MSAAHIQHFYDADTGTLCYVVSDSETRKAAVIDCVLSYSPVSGRTDRSQCDAVLAFVSERQLTVEWILETHAHADHLSGAQVLRDATGAPVAIGQGIRDVQAHFVPTFNLTGQVPVDGSQFDRLFADGETFAIGSLTVEVIGTPGHTNDSVSYKIGDDVFVGDTLFMPDFGTARCDFPGGDAKTLFASIHRLLSLPEDTRLYMCHDYQPGGRELRYVCTVAEQRAENIHIGGGTDEAGFVAMRETRDAELSLPALIVPAIQVNIRAGCLPDAEDNGIAYLKTPIDTF